MMHILTNTHKFGLALLNLVTNYGPLFLIFECMFELFRDLADSDHGVGPKNLHFSQALS